MHLNPYKTNGITELSTKPLYRLLENVTEWKWTKNERL